MASNAAFFLWCADHCCLIAGIPNRLETMAALLGRCRSLDQSATHDGLQNCEAIKEARSALLSAGCQISE